MSAGRGVQHSEFNGSHERPVHFLQIWIIPDTFGIPAGYEEKHFSEQERRGRLRLIASRDGTDGSVRIQQDAKVYAGLFDDAERAELPVAAGRLVYVHVARGSVTANGEPLRAGDALKLQDETGLTLAAGREAEVLVFDLPPLD